MCWRFLPLLFLSPAAAQVSEDFSDGDFSSNPSWSGTPGAWTITSGQLQSQHALANSSFYLSTPSQLAVSVQWEFFVRLDFNTSSTNYVDVFLTASLPDLSNPANRGYFLRIGNTSDELALYRKDSITSEKIIDGTDGRNWDQGTYIKLVRTADFRFLLFAGINPGQFVLEGSTSDNLYSSSEYFGFLVRQSSSSFFGLHIFDGIRISPHTPDQDPPQILDIRVYSSRELDIIFSESIEPQSGLSTTNYQVDQGMGQPVSVQQFANDDAKLRLVFNQHFSDNGQYMLSVHGVKDIWNNVIQSLIRSFEFYQPKPYDVLITEIMCDPTPIVGLPGNEYLELKNASTKKINLGGWKIGTAAAQAILPDYTLLPDSFLILTASSTTSSFLSYGPVLGCAGFPSLPNEGGLLILHSREGKTMHAVNYHSDWYMNPVKASGGWSLEMVSTGQPCIGWGNWKASTDPKGGTPGTVNSVHALIHDEQPPRLIRGYAPDSLQMVIVFNEPLDSITTLQANAYSLAPGSFQIQASPTAPLFDRVVLNLSSPMQKDQIYSLSVSGVKDCAGNEIGADRTVKVGLPMDPGANDLVINELLVQPRPGKYEFVELYNRSRKIIDAGNLFLATKNLSGITGIPVRLFAEPLLIFPGEYVVLTRDPASLQQEYFVPGIANILSFELPSLPNDTGQVLLLHPQGLLDEVDYSEDWHFPLISDPTGISLEKIDPNGPSMEKQNWHSASSTAGYATPGARNSQYRGDMIPGMKLEIQPMVISPDNDGRDDFLTIGYETEQTGQLANIVVFDSRGRKVRSLVKNGLMGTKGFWTWNGLDDKNQLLPSGPYIIHIIFLHLSGKKEAVKKVVSVNRR
jgi:hypothetical protein